MTNAPKTSSFLMHTPPEALHSSIFRSTRFLHHYTQTPSSIIMKMRLNKYRTTTPMTTTTILYRGDQQPPTDDEDIEVIPLGVTNQQPVTVPPIYFNERDYPPRRINSLSLFSHSNAFIHIYVICHPFITHYKYFNSSNKTWKNQCDRFIFCVYIYICFSYWVHHFSNFSTVPY